MSVRTTALKARLRPLLELLAPELQSAFEDLTRLAQMGEAAQQLVASLDGPRADAKPVANKAVAKAKSPKRAKTRSRAKAATPAKPAKSKSTKSAKPAKPAKPTKPTKSTKSTKKAPAAKKAAPSGAEKSASAKPAAKGGAAKKGGRPAPVRDAIVKALTAAGRPLTLAEILSGAKAAGYKTSSTHVAKVIANTLAKMTEVERTGRGVYSLASAKSAEAPPAKS